MKRRWAAVALALLVTASLALLVTASLAEARAGSWLGVRIRDLSEQEQDELTKTHGIREGYGVVIVEVMEGTPAQRAGMKIGDIVVAVDGRPVTDSRLLQRLIAAAPVERDARLTVLRPEGRQALGAGDALVHGRRLEHVADGDVEIRPAFARTHHVFEIFLQRHGVLHRILHHGGLETGDVILQINDTAVVSRDAAREALADLATERPFKLTVRRGERHLALDVPAAQRVSR